MVPEMNNNGEFPFDLEESRTITGAPFRRNQTSSSNGTMFVFVVPESSPDIHGDEVLDRRRGHFTARPAASGVLPQ